MWDHKIEQYAISTALGLRMSYLSRHDKPYRQSSLTWYVTWYSMNIYTIPTSKPNALTLSPNKIVQHFLSTRLCISLTHNLSIQRLQWTCKSYVHRTGHVHNQLWVWWMIHTWPCELLLACQDVISHLRCQIEIWLICRYTLDTIRYAREQIATYRAGAARAFEPCYNTYHLRDLLSNTAIHHADWIVIYKANLSIGNARDIDQCNISSYSRRSRIAIFKSPSPERSRLLCYSYHGYQYANHFAVRD